MSTENASLLAEVAACRDIVEDFTKRLDDACVEYYQTGKTVFPTLSLAEEEDTHQRCVLALTHLQPTMPDAMTQWENIKYPSGGHRVEVERTRDQWVRRRNLFRVIVSTLRANSEAGGLSKSAISGNRAISDLTSTLSKKIFIVHGHGGEMKEAAARLVAQLQLEPLILHEQPSEGLTIIEKFSEHAKEAGFAIVLLTGDDLGREKTSARPPPLRPRARQNVVFEMGFFYGFLGRGRVCAVHEPGVEIPSELGGVLYVAYDAPSGKWRYDVAKELRRAGFDIDMNLL